MPGLSTLRETAALLLKPASLRERQPPVTDIEKNKAYQNSLLLQLCSPNPPGEVAANGSATAMKRSATPKRMVGIILNVDQRKTRQQWQR
jgi:hypothetical protein